MSSPKYPDINVTNTMSGRRLFRIVCSLSTIAIFTKIFGFAEKFVIAHFFGTTDKADIYFAATGIILSIIWLVRELMYPSLLPVYVDAEGAAKSAVGTLFKKAFLCAMVFLIAASLIIATIPKSLTAILVPGFSLPKQIITARLLQMLTPAMIFLGLGMVTYTALNAHRYFLKAACPEAAMKLFVVLGLFALLPFLDIYAVALVMGIGSLIYLFVHLYFIPESRFLLKPYQEARGGEDYFKRVLLLMGPLVVGVLFSHVSGIIDNILASTLPSGHLSYLGYSKKLIDAILLIGPVALVTVVYTQLSHLASRHQYEEFSYLLIKVFRILLYLSVFVGCVLVSLRQPLIRFLFQRGHFGAQSTFGTSKAFMVYSFGVATFAIETLLVHCFFALSDTKTPVKYGILCVILDIALAIILLKPLGYLGIAGAFVASKTIKIVILATILNKRLHGLLGATTFLFVGKLAVSAVVVCIVLGLIRGVDNCDSFIRTAIFDLTIPGLSALAAFILCSFLMRISELKELILLVRHRKSAVLSLHKETK